MELPKAYGITDGAFLRLDSIQRFALIPYCLLTDSIHGFAVIKLGLNQGSVLAFCFSYGFFAVGADGGLCRERLLT